VVVQRNHAAPIVLLATMQVAIAWFAIHLFMNTMGNALHVVQSLVPLENIMLLVIVVPSIPLIPAV
jgi:hypothetical protein